MKKIIILVKRKPGMSKQAFRDYYEGRHAFLCPELFNGMLVEFGRYYIDSLQRTVSHWDSALADKNPASIDPGFDAIGIYGVSDEATLAKFAEVFADPDLARILIEDELNFMDRPNCLIGICDAVEGEGMVSDEGREVHARLAAAGRIRAPGPGRPWAAKSG